MKRMADKPFALIGVNSDRKERVLEAIQRENITWRSFWDGGSTGGPIAKAWGVHAWPTIYFIDDRGVIRDKNKRGAAMDRVVDELVQEALARMHELAQDEDPAVRSLAAFRMGRYNAPKARETLVKLIKDGSSLVRRR
ncbi:MAG: redoxin domain-containing protein, partial [Planctomycetes bacterium]|nr:redoxin domain-containing protein [Planctomycetota bacterium]